MALSDTLSNMPSSSPDSSVPPSSPRSPSVPPNLYAGQLVGGKYELLRKLGTGAMGEVWAAKHLSLDEEVAIKIVLRDVSHEDGSTAESRFLLEARVAATLSRKTRHIVIVTDHGEDGPYAYLVMELLEGESLDVRLAQTGPLSLEKAVPIVYQIARALAVAHADGILHRDLKPSNVFVTLDEEGRSVVKILDFGIAKLRASMRRLPTPAGMATADHATLRGFLLGTPAFMSPEQARGRTLDARADVWALAVIAYHLLTGQYPFEGETPEDLFALICRVEPTPIRERRPDLPAIVGDFFSRAFAERIDDRFQSAVALAGAFEQLDQLAAGADAAAAGRPIGSGPPRRPSRPDGSVAPRASTPPPTVPPFGSAIPPQSNSPLPRFPSAPPRSTSAPPRSVSAPPRSTSAPPSASPLAQTVSTLVGFGRVEDPGDEAPPSPPPPPPEEVTQPETPLESAPAEQGPSSRPPSHRPSSPWPSSRPSADSIADPPSPLVGHSSFIAAGVPRRRKWTKVVGAVILLCLLVVSGSRLRDYFAQGGKAAGLVVTTPSPEATSREIPPPDPQALTPPQETQPEEPGAGGPAEPAAPAARNAVNAAKGSFSSSRFGAAPADTAVPTATAAAPATAPTTATSAKKIDKAEIF
jgi:eukaryotic-like serine/threonine-protein kinase